MAIAAADDVTLPLKSRVKSKWSLYLHGFMLASTGLFYGYGLGLFNNFFEHFIPTFNVGDAVKEKNIQQNLNMFFVIGGTIACLFSSTIFERYGRYKTLLFAFALEMLVCAMMQVHSIKFYYAMRVVFGFVGCMWTFLASVMMAEMLPEKTEEYCAPLFTGMISLGIIAGFSFCDKRLGPKWRWVMLSPLLTEVPKLVYFFFIRMESPRWLSENGATEEELKKNYLYLYKPDVAELLAKKIHTEHGNSAAVPFGHIFRSEYRTQMFVVFLLNMLNQLTGGGLLEFYSTNIFESAGIPHAAAFTIGLGVISLVAGGVAFWLTPTIGLRNMLISGIAGQSFFYAVYLGGEAYTTRWLIVGGIYLSYFSYCISLGGVLFAYVPKIFPPSGISFVAFFQWALSCYLGGNAETLRDRLSTPGLFFIAQVCASIGGLLFVAYSVDVENKEASAIKAEFQRKSFLG